MRKNYENLKKNIVDSKELNAIHEAGRIITNSEKAKLREKIQLLETNLDILRSENEKISVANIDRLKEIS